MTARQCLGWIVFGATTVLLSAADGIAHPAKTFTGWECVIDVKEALGSEFQAPLPEVVRTTRTDKLCTGGPSGNIMITCKAQIPGWAGGNRTFTSVPCQISRTQCGQSGFVLANNTSLKIKSSGEATLDCKRVGAG